MACFNPMQALRLDSKTKLGKSKIVFKGRVKDSDPRNLYLESHLVLPCGQCVGCRLERSRQWAIRMSHEAQLHDDNCFITLTFDDKHLNARDKPMSLCKKEFQDFMKRLRKKFSDIKIRFYMCGEYGEQFKRPHYHAILFGLDFPDKVLEKVKDGKYYYSSALLRECWKFGNNIITDVTFDSCAYVARYIMKKHFGKDAWKNYFEYLDELTGELVGHRIPEYTTMSRRSGIGKEWLDKYLTDVYPKDKVFMRDKGCYSRPPKYYDTQYEVINPDGYLRIKEERSKAALLQVSDLLPDRLHAKQVVKLAQIRNLKRNLE